MKATSSGAGDANNGGREAGEVITFRAIGVVENDFDEPTSLEVIRAAESRIVIDPGFVDGLRGLAPGDRILALFLFHRSQSYDLRQHPRGDRRRPLRGVFALRSPRRPNPIGATIVDIVAIDGPVLRVHGLDALNGSPLLNLKPA